MKQFSQRYLILAKLRKLNYKLFLVKLNQLIFPNGLNLIRQTVLLRYMSCVQILHVVRCTFWKAT